MLIGGPRKEIEEDHLDCLTTCEHGKGRKEAGTPTLITVAPASTCVDFLRNEYKHPVQGPPEARVSALESACLKSNSGCLSVRVLLSQQ